MRKEPNENRPGYKRTKVGWIPEGWTERTAGSCCRIRNELRKPISVEVRKGKQGLYPYYGPTGILDYIDECRVRGTFALIGEDGDHFLKYAHRSMTLMVTGEFNVNNHAHIVEGTAACTTEWFFLFFRHRNIYPFLTRQGAGRYKLNKETLRQLPMALPPPAEQRKISRSLFAWDEAIEQTRKLIDAKKRRKKGLMQQLLTGKKRVPEFSGNPKPIERLGPHVREVNMRNKKLALTNVLSVTNDRGFVRQGEQFEREVASKDRSQYKVIRRGQFAYNPSRVNVGSIALLDAHAEGILSPMYVVFEADQNRLEPSFLRHFTQAYRFREQVRHLTQGSVRDSLGFDGLRAVKCFLPSLTEQKAIAETLAKADEEITCHEQELAALEKQKRGLMQKLLTGTVRVKL